MYKQAPLPFTGQKRMFLSHFKKILNDNIQGDGDGWTIIDVFGGSGLLAHTAKRLKPAARVIYNDFDSYSERLKHINDTNRLRQQIYAMVDGVVPRNGRINNDLKQKIIDLITQFDGYKDLNCMSAWLLFSAKQVSNIDQLFALEFYNRIRKTDYVSADAYLSGLDITSESFHQLIPRFSKQDKVLLLLDPPYLCTKQESYRQETFFDLIDFLRLIDLVKPPYMFFSSTKSEFIRFIAYMVQTKKDNWQSFVGANRVVVNATLCYHSKYEDNLIYKF